MIFRKLTALVVMASLLLLPLAGMTEDCVLTATGAPPLEVAFTANSGETDELCLLKTEPEFSFGLELTPAEGLSIAGDGLRALTKLVMTDLSLKEIIFAIFVPPRIIS